MFPNCLALGSSTPSERLRPVPPSSPELGALPLARSPQSRHSYLAFVTSVGDGLVTKLCLTLVTPWTVAHQAPLSMGFSRQKHWSGLPFPSPGDLPHPGIKLTSPEMAGIFFTPEPPGKLNLCLSMCLMKVWFSNRAQLRRAESLLSFLATVFPGTKRALWPPDVKN